MALNSVAFFLSYFKSCDLDFAPFSRKNAKTVRIVIILFKPLLKGDGFKTHRRKKGILILIVNPALLAGFIGFFQGQLPAVGWGGEDPRLMAKTL